MHVKKGFIIHAYSYIDTHLFHQYRQIDSNVELCVIGEATAGDVSGAYIFVATALLTEFSALTLNGIKLVLLTYIRKMSGNYN